MGFFSSSQTTRSENTMDNPMLQQYTAAYRGFSPWGFASLDPESTLLAMNGGTSVGSGKSRVDLGTEGKRALQNMSKEQKAEADAANDALARIQQRQESGQFLTPQETTFVNQQLDKAFESSRSIAFQDWTRGAQQLAGGRGLRMSDTPVADPALRSLRDMELGFSSQRASAGLDATMKLSGQQMAFDQGLMDSLKTLQFNRWNTRQAHLFGGGLQAAGQLGYKTTGFSKTTLNPSTMSNISQSIGVANQLGGFMKNFGGPLMNLSSMSNASGSKPANPTE
jgi:hypothetical protein